MNATVPKLSPASNNLNPPQLPKPPSHHQITGWDAVEVAFDEFDKKEVEGYKEDIDTLLVFAGLYSAVLTAFVIESYPLLQEDTAAESLQALRQIVSQTAGYALSGGQFVNTTAAISSLVNNPPSFEPSSASICVNVLWFSSLVISLSTASLGILVKQWLREYLAFSTSSAQGKLRVRDFRRGGLETWRVFEIASILPLLLQLSLILFFIGLCYFTLSIHPSVGHTTLPLVCAWGFLFFCTIVAPVFSARCPYKVPALRTVTTAARTRVYVPFSVNITKLFRILSASITARTWYVHSPIAKSMKMFRRVLWITYCILRFIVRFPMDLAISSGLWKQLTQLFCSLIIAEDSGRSKSASLARPLEETEVVRQTSKDLDILVSADALQANDELLGTVMKAALEQSKPTWREAVSFLLRVIRNRIPWSARPSDDATLLDVRVLSVRAREAFADMFSQHVLNPEALNDIRGALGSSNTQTHNAISWVACLFISLYQGTAQVPVAHSRFLLECVVRSKATHSAVNRILFDALLSGNLGQLSASLKWVLSLACQICQNSEGANAVNDLSVLTKVIRAFRLPGKLSAEILQASVEDTTLCLFIHICGVKNVPDTEGSSAVLADAVYHAIRLFIAARFDQFSPQWKAQLNHLGPKLHEFESRRPLQSLLLGCIGQPLHYLVESASNPQTTLWGLRYVDYNERALLHLREALANLTTKKLNTPLDEYDVLALCYIITRLAETNAHTASFQAKDGSGCHPWRPLFDILATLLRDIVIKQPGIVWEVMLSNHLDFISECWKSIEKMDEAIYQAPVGGGPLGYDSWLHTFKEEDSPVGDYFCWTLMTMHGDPDSRRVRRLTLMADKERQELERKIAIAFDGTRRLIS